MRSGRGEKKIPGVILPNPGHLEGHLASGFRLPRNTSSETGLELELAPLKPAQGLNGPPAKRDLIDREDRSVFILDRFFRIWIREREE